MDENRLLPGSQRPVTAQDLAPHLVQFNGNPQCPICTGPQFMAERLLETLQNDAAPDIPGLARQHGVPIKTLLMHIYDCCAANPHFSRTQVNEAASQFAENVVNALARTVSRSESILDQLYDEESIDEFTGNVTYPNRSINLAMAYNQIARTHAATLDGIVAAGERKRLAQRLQQLEELRNSNPNVVDISPNQTKADNSTQTDSVLKTVPPRRSVAQLLRLAQSAPEIDPLS